MIVSSDFLQSSSVYYIYIHSSILSVTCVSFHAFLGVIKAFDEAWEMNRGYSTSYFLDTVRPKQD